MLLNIKVMYIRGCNKERFRWDVLGQFRPSIVPESLNTTKTSLNNISNATFETEHPHATSGITSKQAYFAAILIGLVRLLSSLLLSNLIRKFPRRSMFFTSAVLTAASLATFASCSWLSITVKGNGSTELTEGRILSWLSLGKLSRCLKLLFAACPQSPYDPVTKITNFQVRPVSWSFPSSWAFKPSPPFCLENSSHLMWGHS